MNKKPNVLLLADTTHPANAVIDHIKAITQGNEINWHIINPLIYKTIDKLDWTSFDAVGLHYSIKPYGNYYVSSTLRKKLQEYPGLKFLFLQDEYQRVNEVQEFLVQSEFKLLFTLVDDRYLDKAYPDKRLDKLMKVPILTAYVNEEMKHWDTTPLEQRSIDVSYRGRHYDYWLGSLTYERELIATQFARRAPRYNLRLDISLEESDRVYGANWLNLLNNSKSVLGTESGASIWDFDRSIEKKTKKYLKHHRSANFEEVYDQILKPYDGNIMYSAISPRVFEAAATKTPMIMFPGYYSGVCKPDEHYIPLNKDFSNLDEVISKLKDVDYLYSLANRTYEDLILSDKYSQFELSKLIDQSIIQLITPKEAYAAPAGLATQVEQHKIRYRQLNILRRFKTEFVFIIGKFCSLLSDPRVHYGERIKNLFKGCNRYFVYLTARFTKHKQG